MKIKCDKCGRSDKNLDFKIYICNHKLCDKCRLIFDNNCRICKPVISVKGDIGPTGLCGVTGVRGFPSWK